MAVLDATKHANGRAKSSAMMSSNMDSKASGKSLKSLMLGKRKVSGIMAQGR